MRPAVLLFLLLAARVDASPPDNMVLVPAGAFMMGSDQGFADEAPPHRVHLPAFYIDREEVTNEAFAEFVRDTNGFDGIEGSWFRYYPPGCHELIAHYQARYQTSLEALDEAQLQNREDGFRWRAAVASLRAMPEEIDGNLPVRGVTWRDAVAYARWAGKRLPTEAEWEKAARGVSPRRYPWGSEWDPARCRAGLGPLAGPVAVGSFPDGESPYGCRDMAGNVWEWVSDWYGEEYYAASGDSVSPLGPEGLPHGRLPTPSGEVNLLRNERQGRESDTRKVIRGGAWSGLLQGQAAFNSRCARRLWSNPSYWHPDVGFRCAQDAE